MKKKTVKIPVIEVAQIKTDLRKKEPPLLSLQVSNPVTYIKSWWKRVMGNEGIDFHFKIKPLTAIGMTIVIATFGFGVGRITLSAQKPYFVYEEPISPAPMPTVNPWRDTAFTGSLRFSAFGNRYYLLTNSDEAINLNVPESVDLSHLIGDRIFATGSYNQQTRTLVVSSPEDLEVLPKEIEAVPVITPTITPLPTEIPTTAPTMMPTVFPTIIEDVL
ncbi:hypothetical protein KKF92_03070 [Patescibacteria group bacterium]|nr:hypothetical protein [Patescibacteria group bacterium]